MIILPWGVSMVCPARTDCSETAGAAACSAPGSSSFPPIGAVSLLAGDDCPAASPPPSDPFGRSLYARYAAAAMTAAAQTTPKGKSAPAASLNKAIRPAAPIAPMRNLLISPLVLSVRLAGAASGFPGGAGAEPPLAADRSAARASLSSASRICSACIKQYLPKSSSLSIASAE